MSKVGYVGKELKGGVDPAEAVRIQYLRNLTGLLTEEDLQLTLGVSDWTLQQWRMDGKGPKFVKLGKAVFYRLDDITAWISASVRQFTERSTAVASGEREE